jgi:hypothetical protein
VTPSWFRVEETSSSGPLKPGPNFCATSWYAPRVVVPDGSLPKSGKPSFRPRAGAASASSTTTATIVAGHGRPWIQRLQRAASGLSVSLWCTNGTRSLSILRAEKASSAGSSVSAPAITTSTATIAAMATP